MHNIMQVLQVSRIGKAQCIHFNLPHKQGDAQNIPQLVQGGHRAISRHQAHSEQMPPLSHQRGGKNRSSFLWALKMRSSVVSPGSAPLGPGPGCFHPPTPCANSVDSVLLWSLENSELLNSSSGPTLVITGHSRACISHSFLFLAYEATLKLSLVINSNVKI